MKHIVMLGVLSALAAACGGKDHHASKQGGESVTVVAPKLERDVPEMSSTYKEAYDEAKKEITKENAKDKLDDLEHDIYKGR